MEDFYYICFTIYAPYIKRIVSSPLCIYVLTLKGNIIAYISGVISIYRERIVYVFSLALLQIIQKWAILKPSYEL